MPITCMADAGHALQRKVKYFDLASSGEVSNFHYTKRKKEELGVKVSLWSWTAVSWGSFSILLIRTKSLPCLLYYSIKRCCQLKTWPGAGEMDSLDCISRNTGLSFQCTFPLSFTRQPWSCSFPDFAWAAGHNPN